MPPAVWAGLAGCRRPSTTTSPTWKQHPELTILRQVTFGQPRTALLDAAAEAQLIVLGNRDDAPLFFANAEDFRRRALAAADSQAPVRWFVLNVEANVEVDFTALEPVDAVRAELARAGTVRRSTALRCSE
jgi:hypothetical protein